MTKEQPYILAVDDDKRNLKIMLEMLEEDYNVNFAYSGESCLDNVSSIEPDLILLDIMMPGLNGYEVCKKLKAQEKTRNIPVIFVSGKDSLEDRITGFEVGAEDYFIKPFDHDALLAKIKAALGKASEKSQLTARANEASAIAFKAMTENSRLGCILQFMEASFNTLNYKSLCERIFETTMELGLSCSVLIHAIAGGDSFSASDNGVISPLEESILSRAKHKGRFFDFQNRSIVNYDHISLIIKNMPLDDEVLYGSIKDNICYLLNGADACIKGLQVQMALQQYEQHLLNTINSSTEVMDELRNGYHKMSLDAATIVEDIADEINKSIMQLELSFKQEKTVEEIAERGLQRTIALFNKGIGIDEKFAKLTKNLHQFDEMNREPIS